MFENLSERLERSQDVSGAIREELGRPGMGDMAAPTSNADYGNGLSLIHI